MYLILPKILKRCDDVFATVPAKRQFGAVGAAAEVAGSGGGQRERWGRRWQTRTEDLQLPRASG